MPPFIEIRDLDARVGGEAVLRGWLHHRSCAGNLLFLQIRDGSGFVQAVVSRAEVGDAAWETGRTLPPESSLTVAGRVVAEPRARTGCEIRVDAIEPVGIAPERPAPYAGDDDEGLSVPGAPAADLRHLHLRDRRRRAVLIIRAALVGGVRDFLEREGYTAFDPPVLTADPDPQGEPRFAVDYFGDRARLAASARSHLTAGAAALGKVYAYGPRHRAVARPAGAPTEFWTVEAEAAWARPVEMIDLAERMIRGVVGRVFDRNRSLLVETLARDGTGLLAFLGGAVARLPAEGASSPRKGPHFLVSGPPDQPEGASLQLPGVAGPVLAVSPGCADPDRGTGAPEAGMAEDLRRYGGFPSAGFVLYVETATAWICGLDDPGDAAPFPRRADRLRP